jgi:hypothetical protein
MNPFVPSKTAQNGLNFISLSDETYLALNQQSEEIINIFKIMFLLMNEPYEDIKEEDMIKYLITDVYDRVGVSNISNIKVNNRMLIYKLYHKYILLLN